MGRVWGHPHLQIFPLSYQVTRENPAPLQITAIKSEICDDFLNMLNELWSQMAHHVLSAPVTSRAAHHQQICDRRGAARTP